jgi:hypothetical protein
MTMSNPVNVANVRWTEVNSLADGTLYCQAYMHQPEVHPKPFAEVQVPKGGTERECYDAIRIAILKTLKKPTDFGIVNNRGDAILVGGGY